MIDFLIASSGILFGALGAFLALRQHINAIQIEANRKLQEQIKQESDSKLKAYAAEREFGHIRRQYEQLAGLLLQVDNELRDLRVSFVELKGQLTPRVKED